MNIHELVERGSVWYPDGQQHTAESIRGLSIPDEAEFEGPLTIDHSANIGVVRVGPRCMLGNRAHILNGAYLDEHVIVGPGADIEFRARVFRGTKIGAFAILSTDVVIGPDVDIPAGSQIGTGMIIPSPKTIAILGSVGNSHRIMTIHGSDDGPRYSAGCQYSDSEAVFFDRIANSVDTSPESAQHYQEFLDAGVIQTLGRIVQAHYDAAVASGLVAQLREQAAAITTASSQALEDE